MDDLYLDTIIDIYKYPQHKGWIHSTDSEVDVITKKAVNPSCGDQFEISVLIKDGTVMDALWRGQGCAISTASIDLVCGWMIGKSALQLSALNAQDIHKLTGIVEITKAREKCLFLPLDFKNALEFYDVKLL